MSSSGSFNSIDYRLDQLTLNSNDTVPSKSAKNRSLLTSQTDAMLLHIFDFLLPTTYNFFANPLFFVCRRFSQINQAFLLKHRDPAINSLIVYMKGEFSRLSDKQLRLICQVGPSITSFDFAKIQLRYDIAVDLISYFPKLRFLNLGHCQATNSVLVLIGATLPNLEWLNLTEPSARHSITNEGIRALQTVKLRYLNLTNCKRITDQALIPVKEDQLFFRSLQHLMLSGCNAVTDTALFSISKLPLLRILDISSCRHFTNDGLSHLKQNARLQSLNLTNDSQIDDRGIAHLHTLRKLQLLFLTNCHLISNNSLSSLSSLTHLSYLSLDSCNRINQIGVFHITALHHYLLALSMSHCQLQDPAIRHLPLLRQLTDLDISSNNQLTDLSLSYISQFSHLQRLNLENCQQFTNVGLTYLQTMRELEQLFIRGCTGIKTETNHGIRVLPGYQSIYL